MTGAVRSSEGEREGERVSELSPFRLSDHRTFTFTLTFTLTPIP